ncbi:MAG TPA: hypothetical protein VNO33_11460 [Kofleriaceae bacterium]|nr:hypothetical protein [Kofleriaceae bacterium]
MSRGKRHPCVLAALVVCGAVAIEPAPCAAQSKVAAAAKAFSLAQQAELSGDHRAAAEHYELADRMVPSPEALRSAVRMRLKAGDEASAATLAETLARRHQDERSKKIAADILDRLRPRLARVSLSCTPSCGAVVDGAAVGVDEASSHIFYVEPGRHTIGAGFGAAGAQQQQITAQAGKSVEVALAAEPAPAIDLGVTAEKPARRAPPSGLSRGWFIASAALTVGLAGATVWSGLDVIDRNEKYEANPTQERLEDGQDRELRTNILLGATATMAVATGIIAWKTRWSSPEAPPAIGLAPASGGGMVVYGGRFR